VDAASVNFYEVAELTDRTTVLIFSVSVLVAIGVAVSMSRQLTRGLSALKAGAASIGSGNLDDRIQPKGNDELADLGRVFNEMTGRLQHARNLLTHASEQERQKSEELGKALDQLRKAQDQLVVQQKLASLGSLTAGIAHEIKNPLNFVTNFAEISVSLVDEIRTTLAGQVANLPEREQTYIQDILDDLQQNVAKIQEHGKRADGIVRNMLMHSRGQAGDRQTVNMNALVAEYVRLAYHGMRAQNSSFNVTINEQYDPAVEPVSVVPHDLSRVFLNVATNACYAAYEKKKRLGAAFSPVVSASTKNTPDTIEIRIKDNGDGIPDEVKRRIFEPFFTTKPTGSGTGLGLSMSFEIVVQQHKGQIRVESSPGDYAEFIINIPKRQG
jgi:signal transduction histidine kinase